MTQKHEVDERDPVEVFEEIFANAASVMRMNEFEHYIHHLYNRAYSEGIADESNRLSTMP